jgi:cytochrome b subunit of formate dehydrogenase
VPNLKDARDIRDLFKYLLFMTDKKPEGARFTWKEKFDYWAPYWGIVIIGSSGLIMWNKVLATKILPGQVINFALIAHSDEALLAALFLFIWHWYNVHFSTSVFPMGTVFLTGYLPEEIMIEEHYEHYVEMMKKAGLEHEIRPPHGSHTHISEERRDTL